MATTNQETGSEAGGGHDERDVREPDDSRRGYIAPTPADVDEARADREMADAERSVVMGTALQEMIDRVHGLEGARSHEERRDRWMDR